MEPEVEKLIRLLIVDEGLHKAEQITSSLRAAGMQVRAEFAEDGEDMVEIMDKKTVDLVLFSIDLPDFTLQQAQHIIRECGRHVALVAITKNYNAEAIVKSINEGAQDLVSSKNLDHLIPVIKREAFGISLWRKARHLELELIESEKRCQSLLGNSKDAVAYVHEGMHIYANEAYMELFGSADIEDLESTPIMDLVIPSQQNELKTFLRTLSQNKNDSNQLDLKLLHSSGETLDATMQFSRASFDGEPCTQILIRAEADTSELEEQINYLHQHDLITGLFNRQFFMDELKTSISQAVNGLSQSAVVFITIDSFQSIRDRVGISGCDILISDIAKILQKHAPEGQVIARFGAYSYVCLGVIENREKGEKFARKIPVLVEKHISEIGNQSISATCSTGICFIDENSPDNANEIVARAEKTCDAAQAAGGNQSNTYVPKACEMTQEEEDSITTGFIKDALNNNLIKAYYQPLVSIKAEAGERYLSSLEIGTADGKVLKRDDYQAAAERTGTAKTLDRWAILHAIKKIAEGNRGSRKVELFILLSADSVLDTNLAPWIAENLVKAGVSGEQLAFMVNEGHAVNHLKAVKALFKGLKQISCQFAIDEFGTGLNPFQLVKHINADYVRINIAYMENLPQNSENQQSIRELASQTASMGIRAITPGVEDAAILSVLWSLGVDFVQGNFLQAPEKMLSYDFSSMSI